MRKVFVTTGAVLALATLAVAAPALAGGNLDTYDVTGFVPSPIPGHIIGKMVPMRWDPRCIPVRYRVNSTLDPVPNPLGPPSLTVAAATPVFQKAFDSWNAIPTSYIDMRIIGTVANPGLAGFDLVNEVTFRTPPFGAIAVSSPISLVYDLTLNAGEDIDGDGDPDIAGTITTCADVDNDGDIEFPAGLYKAGTIFDNDVMFNTTVNGYRFTVNDAEADNDPSSVDLEAVAVHEFGHSHGLSHSVVDQASDTDGNAATMFPFISTHVAPSELAQRTLEEDDIAWSSYTYPEGTAASGPAALQPGDVPFHLAYSLIKGNVTHGVLSQPVAGAVINASAAVGNHKIFTSGFSGTTQVSVDEITGVDYILSPSFNILDGNYVLPVRAGVWDIGIRPLDGRPVGAGSINTTAIIGAIFGQQVFNEEFFNGPGEGALELRSGHSIPQVAVPGLPRTGVDFVTNRDIPLVNFGEIDFILDGPPGSYQAVRVPAGQILGAVPAGEDVLFHAMQFDIYHPDSPVVPIFAEAILATGTVDGTTATIDLAHPLAREVGFITRENDFAPYFFQAPVALGAVVQNGIRQGRIKDLFLVLRLPTTTPPPGTLGVPPFIGIDAGDDAPLYGLSYVSNDGVTFHQFPDFNFRFSLILSRKPTP